MYAFISPVIAVFVGAVFFEEKLDWGHAAGMALMLGAAFLALRPVPPRKLPVPAVATKPA